MQSNTKRILVLLCVFAICFTLLPSGNENRQIGHAQAAAQGDTANAAPQYAYIANQSVYFYDVNEDYDWAYQEIDYLAALNIARGTDKYLFEPEKTISRADFVLMLYRAYNMTSYASGQYFSDVRPDAYYADAVLAAKKLGIVTGENGRFYPDRNITRQDAIVLLERTLRAAGWTLKNGDLTAYSDASSVKFYAKEAVGRLSRVGIIGGMNYALAPNEPLTRAEMAVMLYRALMVEENEAGEPHYKAHPERVNLCIGDKTYSGAVIANYDAQKTYSGLMEYSDFQETSTGHSVVLGYPTAIDQNVMYYNGTLMVDGKETAMAQDCIAVRVSPYSSLGSITTATTQYTKGKVSYNAEGKVDIVYYAS